MAFIVAHAIPPGVAASPVKDLAAAFSD